MVGLVDPETLDEEPDDAVADQVHRDEMSRWDATPSVDEQEQAGQREVRERLVQERRVEERAGRVARGQMRVVDLETPRQLCRPTEQFLVPVVAPPTDRLSNRQCRRRTVDATRNGDALAAHHVGTRADSEQQAAGNTEAALPDLGDVGQVVFELLPVRGDVIEP